MTRYGPEIELALRLISEFGGELLIERRSTAGAVYDPAVDADRVSTVALGTNAVLGAISIDPSVGTISAATGSFAALGYAAGQVIEIRGVPLALAGPHNVALVNGPVITINAPFGDVTEAETFNAGVAVFAVSEAFTTEALRAVRVKPDGAFDQLFRDGTLTVGQADGFLIAASGVSIEPAPGEAVIWAGRRMILRGVSEVGPDGTPIVWKAVASR